MTAVFDSILPQADNLIIIDSATRFENTMTKQTQCPKMYAEASYRYQVHVNELIRFILRLRGWQHFIMFFLYFLHT